MMPTKASKSKFDLVNDDEYWAFDLVFDLFVIFERIKNRYSINAYKLKTKTFHVTTTTFNSINENTNRHFSHFICFSQKQHMYPDLATYLAHAITHRHKHNKFTHTSYV